MVDTLSACLNFLSNLVGIFIDTLKIGRVSLLYIFVNNNGNKLRVIILFENKLSFTSPHQ